MSSTLFATTREAGSSPLVRPGLPIGPRHSSHETLAAAQARTSLAPPHRDPPTRERAAEPTLRPRSGAGDAVRSPGAALPEALRSSLEQRFDFDFSQVRIHDDARAQHSARQLHAKAFTVGHHIVLGQGRFDPGSEAGRRLLVHEATHVVQQAQGVPVQVQREPPKGEEPWVKDRGGSLYYDTEDEAKVRKAKLEEEGEWSEFRITHFKLKDKTQWRVEMRGRKKTPAPEEGKDTPKKPKADEEKPKPEDEKPPAKKKDDGAKKDEAKKDDGAKKETKKAPPTSSSWTEDKTFDKPEDAETRRQELVKEDEWEETRVVEVSEKAKGSGGGSGSAKPKKRWQVQKRGKLTLGSKTFSLTFDDGPHAASLGKGVNRTEKVLDTLQAKGLGGKAAFFVQTAAEDAAGNQIRGGSKIGGQLIQRMFKDGHEVGIHTGGTKDHESHPSAAKAGRLEQELKDAKSRINTLTGVTPPLVRAPFGKRNAAVEKIYAKLALKHLFWDIDGDAGGSHGLAKLKQLFDSGLAALKRGAKGTFHNAAGQSQSSKIVVLYHDIRKGTANNIGDVVDHIKKKVPGAKFDKP